MGTPVRDAFVQVRTFSTKSLKEQPTWFQSIAALVETPQTCDLSRIEKKCSQVNRALPIREKEILTANE
jgi:hypothetical protein